MMACWRGEPPHGMKQMYHNALRKGMHALILTYSCVMHRNTFELRRTRGSSLEKLMANMVMLVKH